MSLLDTHTDWVVATPAERARRRRSLIVLAGLCALALMLVGVYQFTAVTGSWSYAMDLRMRQVGALVVAGVSVGISSVIFQTIAGSRILTPGVMGFDALYLLVQTIIVFFFGSATFVMLPVAVRATLDTALLTGFGLLLFGWLFRQHSRNLLVLVLVGMVLGALFGSLTSLASRLLSPQDFLTLQDVMFASFTTVDRELLLVTGAITVACCIAVVPLMWRLDVVDLGHDLAVGLGLPYHRVVRLSLAVITVLVATSTALVGPMAFLGLIVANLARQLVGTHRHALVIPAAAATGVVATVAGQLIVTRVFEFNTTLSVVVNLVGGSYFILLLVKAVRL